MVGTNTMCEAILRDYFTNFLGGFASNIHYSSVLYAELMAIIIVMEVSVSKCWNNIWIESDSQVVIREIMNNDIVHWDLLNRWSNSVLDFNVV